MTIEEYKEERDRIGSEMQDLHEELAQKSREYNTLNKKLIAKLTEAFADKMDAMYWFVFIYADAIGKPQAKIIKGYLKGFVNVDSEVYPVIIKPTANDDESLFYYHNEELCPWFKLDRMQPYEPEEPRVCSECGKLMWEGYCINDGDEYYCSDDCLHKHYSQEEWERMYNEDIGYYTEWE